MVCLGNKLRLSALCVDLQKTLAMRLTNHIPMEDNASVPEVTARTFWNLQIILTLLSKSIFFCVLFVFERRSHEAQGSLELTI